MTLSLPRLYVDAGTNDECGAHLVDGELREVEAHIFSGIRHTDSGKVVSPTRRPLFILVVISVRG
jgi:hypothetical protein